MKRLLLTAAVLVLGGSAWAKAPLKPLYCYRFTELDANGGIAAVPNAGTVTDAALTKKVYSGNETVPVLKDGEGQPMLNKFGAYSVFADGWSDGGTCSSYWLESDETAGLGCSSGTGFAISLWFRPTERTKDWNDFFGFRMGDVVYDFEYNGEGGFSVYDFLAGKQNLKNRNNANADASAAINRDDWNHLCVVWHPYAAWRDWKHYGEVWVNGTKVATLLPNEGDNGKNNCLLRTVYLGAWLEMGNKGGESAIKDDVQERSKTGIGEVAVFGCPISDDDVAYLYTHAAGPLPRGREMTVGLHFDRSWVNGGEGDSPTTFVNSGTLQVPAQMLNGTDGINLATEDTGACGSGSGFKVKGTGTGTWFEGDATVGLGASVGTGLTLSYWTYVRDWSPAWSYVLSFGLDEGFDFYHDKTSNDNAPSGEGSFAYYGDCELWDGLNQTFGTWHHHVLVLEPGAQAFQYWQDGVKKGTMGGFKSELTDGLLRRLCIGPTMKWHGAAEQNADAWVGVDELGVYNYAMSEEEIAWLGTHEAALPPLTVTTLARTVAVDGTWGGMSADWTLNGTDRKLVYPSGEDTDATVTLTVSKDAQLAVDTLVKAKKVVIEGSGTLTLSVAAGCAFEPEVVTGSGTLAGDVKLTGTWEIDDLDNKTARGYLAWPADADFSAATINVAVAAGRRGDYLLVENFTGKLPKKVLHQGADDDVFRAVVNAKGNLILRNRAACGLVVVVQ